MNKSPKKYEKRSEKRSEDKFEKKSETKNENSEEKKYFKKNVNSSEKKYGSTGEKKYGSTGEKKYGSTGEKKYGSADEKKYGSTGEKKYGSTGEKKYGSTGEKKYGSTGEKKYGRPSEKKYGNTTEKKYVDKTEKIHENITEKNYEKNNEKLEVMETISADDYVEGRNPCLEVLKAGRTINKLMISKGDREGSIKKIISIAKEKGIIIQEVSRDRLDAISQTGAHQGVIAFVALKEYVEVSEIIEYAKERNEQPLVLILDEIQDVQNFGSILRAADAAGVHGVIIPKRRSVSLNSVVAKTSAGAVEYVKVARVANLVSTIEELKKLGIWITGTDSEATQVYHKADLKGPMAFVIGSEGDGIGRLIREKCDFLVNIPMRGKVDSLNASVATGIVLYEALRQRSEL